jgi:peptidoglycan/xylan/chitin deacetylase (PgdA/CDA1 family)
LIKRKDVFVSDQDSSTKEPWQWSEPEWRAVANRVRAGRSLKPAVWPSGARCAVALSFDADHETCELRDGGKSTSRLSQGEYGARQGTKRILDVLRRRDARATFFVPAVSGLLHPEEPPLIIAAGHEIGIHGWIHERNTVLPAAVERELQMRAADTLESMTGVRPVGIRTPSWDFGPHTLAITREMGLIYDSSLMADDDCYELMMDGEPTGVVELPVEWIRDDAVYMDMDRWSSLRPHTPPTAVFDIFRREFEQAYAEGGLFQLTMHPDIIGHRSRIWILDELLGLIQGHPDVWIATHAEVATYARDHAA